MLIGLSGRRIRRIPPRPACEDGGPGRGVPSPEQPPHGPPPRRRWRSRGTRSSCRELGISMFATFACGWRWRWPGRLGSGGRGSSELADEATSRASPTPGRRDGRRRPTDWAQTPLVPRRVPRMRISLCEISWCEISWRLWICRWKSLRKTRRRSVQQPQTRRRYGACPPRSSPPPGRRHPEGFAERSSSREHWPPQGAGTWPGRRLRIAQRRIRPAAPWERGGRRRAASWPALRAASGPWQSAETAGHRSNAGRPVPRPCGTAHSG